MKIVHTLILTALLSLSFASCGEKKQSNDIIASKHVKKVNTTPVKMQDTKHTESISWLGTQYGVAVSRKADTSLPLTDDGTGNKYYDNTVTVTVTRPNGTVFFDRTFSKTDFFSQIDENYMRNGAMLGMVLEKAEGDFLVFGASVGSPDKFSDEYVPIIVKLSRMGNILIQKDTRLDSANENPDEDENV